MYIYLYWVGVVGCVIKILSRLLCCLIGLLGRFVVLVRWLRMSDIVLIFLIRFMWLKLCFLRWRIRCCDCMLFVVLRR